ncbi:MAG: four helix bundle protein [Rhodopirellula sp.]|nr:four helix bundle protein [Rhodopirellula sp.]
MKTFRDLLVWQKSMALVTEVYRASGEFPSHERYGLSSQIRRCAVSIPSNIAEGFGRHSTVDYIRFLTIANGSLYELQTQVEIALNLGYMESKIYDTLHEQTREIERMMSSLIQSLKRRNH